MIYRLTKEQTIPAPLEEVWAFFSAPQNLNTITPPDMNFEIIWGGDAAMYPGQLIEYRVEFLPGLRSRWLTEIAHLRDRAYFVDEQRIGPYRFWYHEHRFEPAPSGVKMTDTVTYALPFGLFGRIAHALFVRRRLEHIFAFRDQKVAELFPGS